MTTSEADLIQETTAHLAAISALVDQTTAEIATALSTNIEAETNCW